MICSLDEAQRNQG